MTPQVSERLCLNKKGMLDTCSSLISDTKCMSYGDIKMFIKCIEQVFI